MCRPEPGREGKGPGSPEQSLPVMLATQQEPLLKMEKKR